MRCIVYTGKDCVFTKTTYAIILQYTRSEVTKTSKRPPPPYVERNTTHTYEYIEDYVLYVFCIHMRMNHYEV